MKKRYKLIYEDDDKLKGSYSGIPAKDDPALIDVAVLDGSEPVKPEPEPEVKIDNEANMQALKEALELIASDPNKDGTVEPVDVEIEFDHCSADLFREMWESLDAEAFKKFHGGITEGLLLLKYEGVMSKRIDNAFEAISDYGAEFFEFDSRYEVHVETDAETGDARVVPIIHGFEFTGKVVVNYYGIQE